MYISNFGLDVVLLFLLSKKLNQFIICVFYIFSKHFVVVFFFFLLYLHYLLKFIFWATNEQYSLFFHHNRGIKVNVHHFFLAQISQCLKFLCWALKQAEPNNLTYKAKLLVFILFLITFIREVTLMKKFLSFHAIRDFAERRRKKNLIE